MSTFIRGLNLSKKWLKVFILAVIVAICSTAIALGVIYSQKQNYIVQPETNNKVDILDSNSLYSADGLDENIATQLTKNVSLYGDNVALGNAGGSIISSVIKLGGISWTVVYKQNDVLTLFANEPVATMEYGANSNYAQSEVRDYLINEFYPQFLQKVGYEELDSLIIAYGDDRLYYQENGAQAVVLDTLNKQSISNNDGIEGDKIWLPSAYEVGGFANTEYSPKARVNSFKTIQADGFTVNSGLWNTSNEIRLSTQNAWLRSNVGGSVAVLTNGVVESANSNCEYEVRPCINIVLPSTSSNTVVCASATEQTSQNNVLTAVPDYSDAFNQSEGFLTTDQKRDGSASKPFEISKPQTLSLLSDAVMAGQDMAGVYFKLTANIDMTNYTVWSPIGRAGFPFKGNFDGNGFTVSNLASAGSGLPGLFGVVENATIKNVGVINSTWYTTNDNVGGVVCYAKTSLISQCYSDCGVSGENYVGGIVGKIETSASSVSATNVDSATLGVINCYNLHGITGKAYVGGIAGSAVDVSTNSLIGNCYNTGSVSATSNSNVGGITGEGNASSVLNCYFYNSTNNNLGTLINSYESMRTQSTFANWKFTSANGPWFISNVVNDRLPMLHNFMKSATINVKSYIDDCSATVKLTSAGTSYSTLIDVAIGSSVTITATPAYTTGAHYKFVGWYHYDTDNAGNLMQTDRQFTEAGTNATYTFNLNDYYNLEARFVRLFRVEVLPEFAGFSASYARPDYSVVSSIPAIVDNGANWYEEGTVLTITLGNNSQRMFTGLWYGRSQTEINNQIPNQGNDFVKVKEEATNSYEIIVNNDYANISFGNGDEFYLKPTFKRVYNVLTNITLPSNYPDTDAKPTSQLSFIEAGGSQTSVTNGGSAKSVAYDSAITPTVSSVPTTKLTFRNWSLLLDGSAVSASITSGVPFVIRDGITQPADNITTITFMATFDPAVKQVIIEEYVDNALNDSAGKVILSKTSYADRSVLKNEQQNLQLSVGYNTDLYIYVIPSYENGFEYLSNTILSASGITLTFDSTNGLWYNQTAFKAISDTSPVTYRVNYQVISNYSINFQVTVDGQPAPAGVFTLKTTSATGLTINSSIATGYTVAVSDADYKKYYLKEAFVAVGAGQSISLYTRSPQGDAIYQGTQGEQNIFEYMATNSSGGKIVKDLYEVAKVTPGSNNTQLTVTVNFIKITRTISVVEQLGANGAGYVTTTSLQKYKIDSTDVKGGVAGDYILDDDITLTATAGNIGYKVVSITISGPTGNVSIPSNDFNNVGTLTFTLTDNASITIKYDIRTYNVAITDNLQVSAGSTVAGTSIPGLGLSVSNNYKYAIDEGTATDYVSELTTLRYLNVLTISNYNSTFDVTIDATSRKAVLESIVIKNDKDNSIVTYSATYPSFTPADLLSDTRDDVTIIFKYKLLQALNVTFTDSGDLADSTMAALVILVNNADASDRIVVIVPLGADGVDVECQVADYKLYAVLPIFIKSNTTVTGGTGSQSGSDYIVSIEDSVANEINIDISEIVSGNDSVYGSGIY